MEKGDRKRCSPAIFEHLQFCERSVKRSAYRYPWEMGFLNEKNKTRFPFGPIGFSPLLMSTSTSSDGLGTSDSTEYPSVFDSQCRKLFCKMPKIEWDALLDTQRNAALAKWYKIVTYDPMSFEVCRSHYRSVQSGLHKGRLQDDLKNVFAGKSNSTLHGRAGPFMRYLHFCDNAQLKPLPLSEDVVYCFMQSQEEKSSPTFLKSFMSSLGFALHVLGLVSAKQVVESRRVKGLADKCYLTKRKTRSRYPLQVSELAVLEEIVLGRKGRSVADRHAAGCFLFMVYARARFSDMLNVGRLEFDCAQSDNVQRGYIEAQVVRSKTSFTTDRKVRLLPMTATMFGVVSEPWGMAWRSVLESSGVQIGHGRPLLPGRTPEGWHTLPLSAEAATNWLRSMIQTGDYFDERRLPDIGTHSCKSTCLSWLAKWGSSPDVRRLMGYHVADKMSTMLIYGKDNTSAGLREIDEVLDAIKSGDFLPDARRADMFPHSDGRSGDVDEKGFDGQCSDSSSEDSLDEDTPEHEAHEEAENAVLGRWEGLIDIEKLPAEAIYFRHPLSRTIHLQEDESGLKLTCGRDLTRSYVALSCRPQSLLPICKQCFHKFKKSMS